MPHRLTSESVLLPAPPPPFPSSCAAGAVATSDGAGGARAAAPDASTSAAAMPPGRDVSPALTLRALSRHYDGHSVWAPVDLLLESGTLCVVTGPNGSGKTTLLRVAAGLLRPTSGTRWCSGTALYVRAGTGLRSAQTVGDAVAGTAALAGRRPAAQAALEALALQALADRRVGTLSAGERVRTSLAAVLAASPALLCLDEPTGALDEEGLHILVRVLQELRAGGCATLVATHQSAALLPFSDGHLQVLGGRVVPA